MLAGPFTADREAEMCASDRSGLTGPRTKDSPGDLTELFELSPDLLCVADFSGYFIALNPSWSRVLGWSEAELRKGPFIEFVHPEDRPATEAETARLADGGTTIHFENRYVARDGSYRWLSWSARSDLESQLIHAAARDITAQKRGESAEQRLAAIVESSEDAIFGKDLDEVITSWNRAAERLYGYSEAEAVGQPVSIIVPEGKAEYLREVMRHILAGEGVRHHESQRMRKDGSLVDVSISISPVKDASGRVVGSAVAARDIGPQRRQKEELLRSNRELEQFAFVASHDLQEPLRMVTSYVQLLERNYADVLDEEGREFIGYAVDGAKRMQSLIDDLLSFSRIGTKGKDLLWVSADDALDGALSNLRVAIDESGARISRDTLPRVRADIGQLVQLFQNLLGNAIKYRGDRVPQIHVGVEDREAEWRFSVQDNGMGIEPKFADRVFEVFQRLHTRSEYPGTGMGLAICKKIVERHRGRIWLDIDTTEGANFMFTLPHDAPAEGR